MARNMGKYMGVGKETTYGTAVAATAFFLLEGMPRHNLAAPIQRIANPSGFGDIVNYPGQRQASLSADIVATPAEIGHLLAGLLGNPTTTGTAAPYTHTFTPQADVPSYTVEFKQGAGFSQFTGAKWSSLTFRHSTEGVLIVGAEGLAKDRVTGGTAQTPSYPTDVYLASAVNVNLNNVDISCEVEELEVALSFDKRGDACFGSQTIGGVDIASGGEVTFRLTYRVEATPGLDPVALLADYKAGTALPTTIKWVRTAGSDELQLQMAGAVLTADPMVVTNDDLGWARVSLEGRASGADANMITATLINATAGY